MGPLADLRWEELAALTAVAAALARVGWGAASLSIRWLRFRLDAPVKHCTTDAGPYAAIPADAPVKCLVVRYGRDDYLQTLASDQEKWEGRLQNRVLPTQKRCEGDRCKATVRLPVHRRLGTQFKFFVEFTEGAAADRLARSGQLRDASLSHTGDVWRVWFLTDRWPDAPAVGGYSNNYWPPL